MTAATGHQGRWTGTRIAILGLLIAAVAIFAILLVSPDVGSGFALVVGPLLLISAGLVWRFGLAAHVWAAVVGSWLLWSFGWSHIADTFWADDAGAAASVGDVIIHVVTAVGGGVTLFGAVRYLRALQRSSPANRPLGSVTVEAGGGAVATPWGPHHLLAGVAVAAQLMLLSRSFFMGLGWGGFWYVANLGQAAAVVALAIAWFRKHPLRVLALPVASFLLTQVFLAVDPSLKTTECTPSELSAAAEFPPPPGSPAPHFQSEPDNGCIARFHANLTGDQLLEHYRQAAETAGWEVEKPGMAQLETGELVPEESIDIHSRSHHMSNDTMTLEINFESGEQSSDQLWVVLSIHERIR